jgi:hypothetical protein
MYVDASSTKHLGLGEEGQLDLFSKEEPASPVHVAALSVHPLPKRLVGKIRLPDGTFVSGGSDSPWCLSIEGFLLDLSMPP